MYTYTMSNAVACKVFIILFRFTTSFEHSSIPARISICLKAKPKAIMKEYEFVCAIYYLFSDLSNHTCQ